VKTCLQRYELKIDSPEAFATRFNTHYFPGWQARLDDRPVPVTVTDPYGQLTVVIPAGQHRLEVWFGATLLRTTATLLSVFSLGLLVFWRHHLMAL
jgi:uncharacterized membrane protein YfhO